LPNASFTVTVAEADVPAVTEAGVPETVNDDAEAAPTVKAELAADAASAIPEVRVAVNVIDSAFVY
jgi:hypothetical protein